MHSALSHRKTILLDLLSAPDDWHRLGLTDGSACLYLLLRPTWLLRRSKCPR